MITLLLADDHTLFRQGLRQLCEVNRRFTVLAEATTGEEAVVLAQEYQPDVILMDIRMSGITGIEAARRILLTNSSARILMLTMYQQDHYVLNALRSGAAGYLLKDCTEEILFAAINAVHQGHGWLDTTVTPVVLAQISRDDNLNVFPDGLNEIEVEILRLLARGAENQAIADHLRLAKSTIANYLGDIFIKLSVNNRTEAALYALRHGLASLDPEDS